MNLSKFTNLWSWYETHLSNNRVVRQLIIYLYSSCSLVNLYRFKTYTQTDRRYKCRCLYKFFIPPPVFFHPHLSTSFRFHPVGRAWEHASALTDPRCCCEVHPPHIGGFQSVNICDRVHLECRVVIHSVTLQMI